MQLELFKSEKKIYCSNQKCKSFNGWYFCTTFGWYSKDKCKASNKQENKNALKRESSR